MLRSLLWAGLFLTLAACSNTPGGGGASSGAGGGAGSTGGGSGGSGGNAGGGGSAGSGGTSGTQGEYDTCIDGLPGQCISGFECVSFGIIARCVQVCTPPSGTCTLDKLCVPQYGNPTAGYCAMRREHYETCDSVDNLSACDTDAFCLSQSTAMAARCVPICDVGTFGNYTTVTPCPDLIAELGAMPTSCTPITVGTVSGSLCSSEARVSAPCDQASLHCSLDDARPDTDVVEASAAGEPDPGALNCLPTAAGGRCMRICTVDGSTFSPCACPPADPLCDDPVDPGMAWDCLGWDELAASVGGCVALEDCSVSPNVCADNTTSGYTACVATPYSSGPSSVCASP